MDSARKKSDLNINQVENNSNSAATDISDESVLENNHTDHYIDDSFKISPPKKKKRLGKIFLAFFMMVLFLVFSWLLFIVLKMSDLGQKISTDDVNDNTALENIKSVVSPLVSHKHKTLKGENEGRINILLLGAAGENHPGKNLTDTIMIMSINTETKKIALLSLPRDLYVNVSDTEQYTKINSIYQYGLNNEEGVAPLKKTIQNITDIDIHYFFVVDFKGFEEVINDIGGINVNVERDIYDSSYPGPNYSYETFEIKKGLHKLDGATALKYVRQRHDDPEGDFGRARRQQQIIQSTKNKVFSLRTFLNVFTLNKILNTLGNHVKTDIRTDELESLIWWSKEVDTQNINNAVVDAWKKESLLKVSHVYYGDTRVFILLPRVGNYSEIQDLAENLFDLDILRRRKENIEKESARIVIINQSNNNNLAYKIQRLVKNDLEMKDTSILNNPDKNIRNQTIIIDQTSGSKIFTLDELIKKLPAKLNNDNNAILDMESDADIIILLGTDLEKIYNYEENTIEELNNASLDQIYLDLLENK